MSLINKMLQDLDARGGAFGDAVAPPSVRTVSRDARRTPLLLVGALLLVALAAGGYLGWQRLQGARAPAAVAVPAAPVTPKIVQLTPRPSATVVAPAHAPQLDSAAPVEKNTVPAQPAVATKVEAAPQAGKAQQAQATPQRKQEPAAAALVSRTRTPVAESRNVPAQRAESDVSSARPMGVRQRAEAAYRRALASMQQGRNGEAIAMLEQALDIDPGHDAARQTLVGLLIASKRNDEAMRLLQQGLEADPRQPLMAMLLARMQIEHGASGIETLLRTLPYAPGNGEYHAFLAGALQRQQRHREATEQYQAALRAMPNNGIWLMGLGISLQAEKRNQEALDAFDKARAAGNLTPELQAFVEQRSQQLSR